MNAQYITARIEANNQQILEATARVQAADTREEYQAANDALSTLQAEQARLWAEYSGN